MKLEISDKRKTAAMSARMGRPINIDRRNSADQAGYGKIYREFERQVRPPFATLRRSASPPTCSTFTGRKSELSSGIVESRSWIARSFYQIGLTNSSKPFTHRLKNKPLRSPLDPGGRLPGKFPASTRQSAHASACLTPFPRFHTWSLLPSSYRVS